MEAAAAIDKEDIPGHTILLLQKEGMQKCTMGCINNNNIFTIIKYLSSWLDGLAWLADGSGWPHCGDAFSYTLSYVKLVLHTYHHEREKEDDEGLNFKFSAPFACGVVVHL